MKTDEEIYATTESIRIEWLGYRYSELAGMKFDSEEYDLLRRRYDEAKSIRISTGDGSVNVKVVPAALTDLWNVCIDEELTKSDPQMSEEELAAATKQWVAEHFPEGWWWATEVAVIPTGYYVYPNGYGRVSVALGNAKGDCYEGYGNGEFWVKDGVYIAEEEMFDVSYEELLAEVFGTTGMMTPENCAAAAKVLAPYVVSVGLDSILDYGTINFGAITYTFGRVGSIDQDTAAPLLNELSAYLSPYLVDSFRKVVNNQWPEEAFEGKPLLKHLRMLEGYPME